MSDAEGQPDRITRCVTLPIRAVVEPEGVSVLDGMRRAWRLSTDLANWAQRELVLRDTRRTPGMTRFPAYDRAKIFGSVPRTANRKANGDAPAKKVGDPQEGSLYRLFTDTYSDRPAWDGATIPARDVLTSVEKTWMGHPSFGRFAVMWRGEARPCVFRYPFPWPVASDKGKTLRLSRSPVGRCPDCHRRHATGCPDGCGCHCHAGRPHASLPLPGENGAERVCVRLADGREFRRQLRQFDYLIAHPDRIRQAKVTGRRQGGRLVGADLRIVVAFDRAAAITGVTARVSTGAGCVFRAVVAEDDGNPFVIHADQLRGVLHAYDRWRHRFARDLKHEKRWPAEKRRRTTDGTTAKSRMDRMNRRIDSERKQMVSCLVGWLSRRGVADLEYDDSEAGYFDWVDDRGESHRRFDMTALREAVRCKCEEAGISFQHVAGADDATE